MSVATETLPDGLVHSSPLSASQQPLTVALAGNPNTGKTTLFNALTGMRQKVANYPGVTVETKMGQWPLAPSLAPARVIDLPGLYSLDATSLDEQIARDVLLGRAQNIRKPDVVIVAVDATNLSRNLYLATQLIETRLPIIVALTMFDLAERSGLRIDVEKLSTALRVQVVSVIANRRGSVDDLSRAVLSAAAGGTGEKPTSSFSSVFSDLSAASWQERLTARYRWIERVVAEAVESDDSEQPNLSERIDAVVTHRFLGPIILLLVMVLIFQTIFSWANLPMNLIDRVFTVSEGLLRAHFPPGILTDLLVDGVF